MPITIKKFHKGDFKKGRKSDRFGHPISIFLRNHSQHAFKVDEIVKKTKMKEDTVRSMLRRLKDDNLIDHTSPYFAWKFLRLKKK